MSKYLLSVVIPTRNRQAYAIEAVKQAFSLTDESVQIVVQDNSDLDSMADLIKCIPGQGRIRYHHDDQVLSFVENFSHGVELADGEYICMIGDDDGLLAPIADVARWAGQHGIDAVKPGMNAVYYWPGSEARKGESDNGYLQINGISDKARIMDPHQSVIRLLRQGGQHYLQLDMVKLYHGLVKRSCLDAVRRLTGHYFGGLSPDIYIAVALSLVIDKLLVLDFPLTISGICSRSGSADSATGRHTGQLEEAPHFRGHTGYIWSEWVPRFYCVETIWADSAIHALADMGRGDLMKEFSFSYLDHICAKKYPAYIDTILAHEANRRSLWNRCGFSPGIKKYPTIARELIRRALGRIRRTFSVTTKISNVSSIMAVDGHFQAELRERRIDFNQIQSSLDDLCR